MYTLIKNFILSTYRDKHLRFWELIFPGLMVIGFALFARGKDYATFILPSLFSFLLIQNLVFPIPYRIGQFKENSVLLIAIEEKCVSAFSFAFLIARAILITIQSLVFIPIATLILSSNVSVNIVSLLLSYLTCLIALAGLGLLVAAFTKTSYSALNCAQMVTIALLLVSGIFYPIDQSPNILKVLSYISPLKYSRQAFEYSLLGINSFPIYPLIIMLVFGVVAFSVAIFVMYKGISYKNMLKSTKSDSN